MKDFQQTKINQVLENSYGPEITEKLISSYNEIEENFIIRKWKPSELDAGHFVEVVRRILQIELNLNHGAWTPFSNKLPNFSDQVLIRYENGTGNESFRLLIPRALKSIYNIRNKRGVGHIKDFSPNEMDSTYILYTVKWVLSEIIRLKTNLSHDETQTIVDSIMERHIPIIWKSDDIERIIDTSLTTDEQILILLYSYTPRNNKELCDIIEYSNFSVFKKRLLKLHKSRYIEYNITNGSCDISPKGINKAEELITKHSENLRSL